MYIMVLYGTIESMSTTIDGSPTTSDVSIRDLRGRLSDAVNRAMYTGERIGITRHGKPVAALVSMSDLEALEAFEMAQDVAAYRDAIAHDDGQSIGLDEFLRELDS